MIGISRLCYSIGGLIIDAPTKPHAKSYIKSYSGLNRNKLCLNGPKYNPIKLHPGSNVLLPFVVRKVPKNRHITSPHLEEVLGGITAKRVRDKRNKKSPQIVGLGPPMCSQIVGRSTLLNILVHLPLLWLNSTYQFKVALRLLPFGRNSNVKCWNPNSTPTWGVRVDLGCRKWY